MKTKFALTMVCLALTSISQAQEPARPIGARSAAPTLASSTTTTVSAPSVHHVGIGIEPHWLIVGGLGAQFDARVSKKTSIALGGMYLPPHEATTTGDSSTSDHYKWSAFEVYTGPSFMITGDYDHHGAYVMPALGYTGNSITDYRSSFSTSSSGYSGEFNTPEFRLTGGYQFVVGALRFTTGGGIRLMKESDVVVKDETGKEVLRQRSNTIGGLSLDMRASYLF
jgi:hypothetical protein